MPNFENFAYYKVGLNFNKAKTLSFLPELKSLEENYHSCL